MRTPAITEIALMAAMMEVGKIALQFIPNVEIVSLLVIVFTCAFGRKTYAAALIFVGLECLVWGFGTWVVMYLYLWPILITVVDHLPRSEQTLPYAIVSGIFGLLFGAFCALVYLVIGGPSMAVSWWIAGIPYDILHGISNFILCMVLFRPCRRALARIKDLYLS